MNSAIIPHLNNNILNNILNKSPLKSDLEIIHNNYKYNYNYNNIILRKLYNNLKYNGLLELIYKLELLYDEYENLMILTNKSNLNNWTSAIISDILKFFSRELFNKILFYNNKLYNKTNGWSLVLEGININHFKDMLYDLIPKEFSLILNNNFKKYLEELIINTYTKLDLTDESQQVIQFKDGYILKDKFYIGNYVGNMPLIIFNFNLNINNKISINDLLITKKLLLNLTNDDKILMDFIIKHFSTQFIRDINIKDGYQKALVLWGNTGTGKSTLIKYNNLALNKFSTQINNTSTQLSLTSGVLSKKNLTNISTSLHTYCEEFSAFTDNNLTSMLLTIIAHGSIEFDKVYQDSTTVETLCTTTFTTNNRSLFDDTSGAIERRLSVIKTLTKLELSNSEFKNLFTDNNLTNWIRLLIFTYLDLLQNDNLELFNSAIENYTLNTTQDFLSDSNPIRSFIDSYPPSQLSGHSVKYVMYLYKQFCYMNEINVQGKTKFYSFLERRCNLVRTRVKSNTLPEEDLIAFELDPQLGNLTENSYIWRLDE